MAHRVALFRSSAARVTPARRAESSAIRDAAAVPPPSGFAADVVVHNEPHGVRRSVTVAAALAASFFGSRVFDYSTCDDNPTGWTSAHAARVFVDRVS